ncbi:MAG: hypothetical protein Q9178_002624 [Gyalolechia marmorata]
MGGLAISIPDELSATEGFVPSGACGTWFITHSGLEYLLAKGKDQLPALTEEEIMSKKLNTLGHAVCALFIYLLWWEKPFEVDAPTIVKIQALLDVFALAWIRTKGETNTRGQHLIETLDSTDICFGLGIGLDHKDVPRDNSYMTPGHPPTSTRYMPGELIPGTDLKIAHWLESIDLTEQDINRWKMAKRAAELRPAQGWDTNIYRKPFRRCCSDLPDISDIVEKFSIAMGFSAAAMVYGGLHALAWNAHFDSPIQQLLWRLSACVVMGGIPTLYVLERITLEVMREGGSFAFLWQAVGLLPFGFLTILTFLVFLTYLIARAYLVVECFIQLSHLPAGVYDVPNWSAYFPHIA